MLRQEQLQKRQTRHKNEPQPSTFPEASVRASGGNGPDKTDEVIEQIDRALEESTIRAVGAATGVEIS